MDNRQDLRDQLSSEGNPIINGNRALICWVGADPPELMADFTDWDENTAIKLEKISNDLWGYEINLPQDSYIEYAFFKDGQRVKDPNNPRLTPNGLGYINHYFSMPDFHPSKIIDPAAQIPHGKIFSARLPTGEWLDGKLRTVFFYQPPVDQPAPLLLVYDGYEYYTRVRLPLLLDHLIATKRIQPVALAMVANSKRARLLEFSCSEATLFYLVEVLLPYTRTKLNLIDTANYPGAFGVLGASVGGLMSLYTGLRLPQIFGHIIAQSGAYSLDNYDFGVWELIDKKSRQPVSIWMDCGKFEGLIETNRKMGEKLRKRGFNIFFNEYNGGHNFPCWREALPLGLEFLFGPNNTNEGNEKQRRP